MSAVKTAEAPSRLRRLLALLEHDPSNLALIGDAAAAALHERDLDTTTDLLGRYEALAPLTPRLRNLKGLAALSRADFAKAGQVFEGLLADNPADQALRFNLAWAKSMFEDFEGALEALDDETAATVPNAAALKIHALHHLGRLEEALACGSELAARHPDDADLLGALANVAIDAEDLELAREYGLRAGDQPEGLAALGMVLLDDADAPGAMAAFDRALEARPDDARAAIGKGLAFIAQDSPAEAVGWLDKGAKTFGDDLDAWIAAGWAYFAVGDLAASRVRFETALAIDNTFAEIHGGLAVLDILQGDIEGARRRTEEALRLDNQCFSGALATKLLTAIDGNPGAAERVRQMALNEPIVPSGKTLTQTMAALQAGRGKPSRR